MSGIRIRGRLPDPDEPDQNTDPNIARFQRLSNQFQRGEVGYDGQPTAKPFASEHDRNTTALADRVLALEAEVRGMAVRLKRLEDKLE